MAYSVNGKIYTDHPLMDEIVDCCKTIFKGIVVKNDVLALSYETDESLDESREYIRIVEKKESFLTFPFTYQMLASFTKDGVQYFTDEEIKLILRKRSVVPVEIRAELLDFCSSYYIENYDERNNYYRSLAGLPPYPGTAYNIKRERTDKEFNIYVKAEDFPPDYDTSHIFHDGTTEVKIHELSNDDIGILQQSGFVDNLIKDYQGFNYSYLRYLGYKAIDIYKARKAIKWEILYIPMVEELVQQRFEELYNINRSLYLKKTYQDAMSLGSNYYDESIILLLLCQTFNDLVVDVPEWYIRRDIFDIRSVQYFLESYGVQFFDVIPLKYQIAIVKNLNKLIKYKSSTKNNRDIIDLFNLKNTFIYKYFLYRKKNNETASEDEEHYDLEFIKVKEGEPFDKYITNNIYRYKYDDLTLSDKFWDGVYKEWSTSSDKTFKEKLHEEIKNDHINGMDYTVEGTKYMSIDYEIYMSEYKYQVEYFFSYLLDSKVDTEDLKIIVPTISTSTELGISNLFILLYLLSLSYDEIPDKVLRPEDRSTHKLDIVTPRLEYYEKLYRDDGDYDDYISWNNKFGEYTPPAHFDTEQFNFGEVRGIPSNDEYPIYDIYNFHQTPPEEIPNPEVDEGWDFNDDINTHPDDYYKRFFKPKHWQEKRYIENQDPTATAEGYNSYPVWIEDNRDWAVRRVPEAFKVSYNRINGFNNALTEEDLDNFIEVITRRNKVYNFEKGYTGYSYKPVYSINNELLYFEIIYEYDELVYTYEEYLQFINASGSEEDYNSWLDDIKEDFLRRNPRGPLGIGGFRVMKKIDSIPNIIENFDINTVCYKDLYNRIVNSNSRDEGIMLRYVFNTLFTREFDYDFYKVDESDATNISEILKSRSYILYNYYNQIISEANVETRKNNIRSVMNDIITTLEYYLSGDNLEFIYSSFSIASFSSLLYYIYLMICFFKSWKVYFLDPAVTVNTDDILENGNYYGNGVDCISEIKLNYWHTDKEFRRDTIGINVDHFIEDKFNEDVKEVLDVYGHFEPDPEDDYNYDGYKPEEAEALYRDINGGVTDASLNIPYIMVNGGKSYGKLLDIWDLDGGTPVEMQEYLRVDGGGVYHPEDLVTNAFDELYNYIINGGNPGTNEFFTKSMHTRVIDRQIEQRALVSTRQSNLIVEDENGLYLKQSWASWSDFYEIKTITDKAYSYMNYVMEVLYDDLMIITDDDLLTQRVNELVDDELYNMRKVSRYAENIDYYRAGYRHYIDNYINTLTDDGNSFSPYSWSNF